MEESHENAKVIFCGRGPACGGCLWRDGRHRRGDGAAGRRARRREREGGGDGRHGAVRVAARAHPVRRRMREREARLLRRAEGRGGLLRHAVRRTLHVLPRRLQLRHPQELVPHARLRHEDAAYGVRGDRDGHEVRLLPRGEREEGRLFVLHLVRHGRRARLRGHRGRLRVTTASTEAVPSTATTSTTRPHTSAPAACSIS